MFLCCFGCPSIPDGPIYPYPYEPYLPSGFNHHQLTLLRRESGLNSNALFKRLYLPLALSKKMPYLSLRSLP